jgi:hypothetical protein
LPLVAVLPRTENAEIMSGVERHGLGRIVDAVDAWRRFVVVVGDGGSGGGWTVHQNIEPSLWRAGKRPEETCGKLHELRGVNLDGEFHRLLVHTTPPQGETEMGHRESGP